MQLATYNYTAPIHKHTNRAVRLSQELCSTVALISADSTAVQFNHATQCYSQAFESNNHVDRWLTINTEKDTWKK